MDWTAKRGPAPGITLVELMTVLAVLALFLVLGAPTLARLLHRNQLQAETHRLVAAINLARSEAVLRNQPVSLCPSAMAATGDAACGGNYAGGWLVFSNPDRDREVSPQRDEIIRAFPGAPPGYRLTNRAGSRPADQLITYLPDGSARRSLTLLVCPPPGRALPPLSVVLNRVGRARVGLGEGRCPGRSS